MSVQLFCMLLMQACSVAQASFGEDSWCAFSLLFRNHASVATHSHTHTRTHARPIVWALLDWNVSLVATTLTFLNTHAHSTYIAAQKMCAHTCTNTHMHTHTHTHAHAHAGLCLTLPYGLRTHSKQVCIKTVWNEPRVTDEFWKTCVCVERVCKRCVVVCLSMCVCVFECVCVVERVCKICVYVLIDVAHGAHTYILGKLRPMDQKYPVPYISCTHRPPFQKQIITPKFHHCLTKLKSLQNLEYHVK